MKNGYYVDPRYLFDDGCGKDKLDFGQRVNRVINIQSYYAHRNYRPGIPPYTQPQFQHPELYFWVVSKHLRVIGTDLELPMEKDWSPSLQEKVARVLGPAWLREPLYEIYRFLEAQTFSEYYDTLLSFKWTARLLSFPLFDQYERIQLIDGKLFGWLPCSTAKDSEYAWQLLTEKTVDKEIRLCSGINKIGRRQKMHLTKLLVRLHQNDPYAKKSSWEKELTVCYQEGVLEYLPSMAAAAVRFSKEKLTDIPYPLWLGTLSSDLQCSDALERTLSTLTDGNVDKLELLAELFARIFCCTIPSKYLWYIHGNSTAFSQWLYLLTDGKVDHALYPSSQSQAEKYLIYDQSLRFLIQWNSDSLTAEQFAHLNHSWLNRYIEGSGVIKIDDSYQVEQTVAYSPAVFFLSEGNTIDTAKAFKKLPWRKLEIPYTWSTPALSLADIQWLKTCFVARGLQITQGLERRRNQDAQTSLEQIVRQFVANFCEQVPDSRIDCKEFFSALQNYTSILPYKVELKGSTTTAKNVEKWMNWKRCEDRKNHNRMAFEGILLDIDKLNSEISEAQSRKSREQQEQMDRDFHEYLTETSRLVLWPPNRS